MDTLPQAQKKDIDNESAPSGLSHVDREMQRRARDEPAVPREPDADGLPGKGPARDLFPPQDTFAVTEQALRAMAEMTPRDIQIARQVALGRSNDEIAGELHLSGKTIRNTLHRLYEKMGLHAPDDRRVKLAVYMMHRDPSLLPEPGTWLEQLTPQVSRTVSLVAQGMSNPQIAGAMGLREKTVKNVLTNAFHCANARSREELAALVWASIHQKTPLRLAEAFFTVQISNHRHCVRDTIISQTAFAFTEEALRGVAKMTPGEVRIARQVALGKNSNEIADELRLSRGTIMNALCVLYEKMGLHAPDNARVKLAAYMLHRDPSLLPEPGDRLDHLTPQVGRAVALMAQGMSNHQIAEAMGLREKTVRNELTDAFQRTKARSREELAALVWACVHQKTPLCLAEAFFTVQISNHRHCVRDTIISQTAFAFTEEALRGVAEMTPREVRIARQVALGRSNDEIADELHLATATVKNTLSALYEKMDLHEPDNIRVKLAVYMMHRDPSLLPEPGDRLEHLTPQVGKAVSLMAQGMSNSQIAEAMGLSEKTVKNELTDAFKRAQTRNREELAGLVWACVHQKTPLRLAVSDDSTPGFADRLESTMRRQQGRGM